MNGTSSIVTDAELAVPGATRLDLALAAAIEAAASTESTFETSAWREVIALDAAAGLQTRLAARTLLHRPSDGRYLLFRYEYADGVVRMVLPGGGAEPGETPSQAAAREVFEETGTHARDLEPSGLLLCHLLRVTESTPTPRIQYSPIYLGTIDDELPDTDGREPSWHSIDELEALPHAVALREAVVPVLRARERGERVAPHVVWLPS